MRQTSASALTRIPREQTAPLPPLTEFRALRTARLPHCAVDHTAIPNIPVIFPIHTGEQILAISAQMPFNLTRFTPKGVNMPIEENIELIKKVVAGGLDVMEFLAEDAVWVIPGFGTYRGKDDIYTKLLAPTDSLMESMGSSVITNIIAQGDYVVVESYAKDRMTKSGKPYNNTYCQVYEVADGLVQHITEYADTALAKEVFAG